MAFTAYQPKKVTAQASYFHGLGSSEKVANLTSKIDVLSHVSVPLMLFNGQELLYNLGVAIAGLSERSYMEYYSNEQYGFSAGE